MRTVSYGVHNSIFVTPFEMANDKLQDDAVIF